MALAAEDVDEVDLVLGGDAGDDADVVDPAIGFLVGHRAELGAGDGLALDAELARDGIGRDGVVAGDHPDLDAGGLCLGDGVAGLGARRVDDPDDGQELEVADQWQEVGVRVERGRIEVALAGGHDPQALGAESVVLGEERLADLVDRARPYHRDHGAELARASSWSGAPLTKHRMTGLPASSSIRGTWP